MKKISILFFLIHISINVFSQDTLKMSLGDAQKLFIDDNLQLVIQNFNVDMSKAQIIQAKLIPNPTINIEQGLIKRPVEAFPGRPWGAYAQHAFQIQQLFSIAGKRNKNIHLAQINQQINEYEFFDLVRTLNYSLNSTFFDLAFQLKTVRVYKQEINSIDRLVDSYRQLLNNGNAALKDVVRLESFLFSLETDLNQLELSIAQSQSDLRVLLGVSTNSFIVPVINDNLIDSLNINAYTLADLITTAEENRFDLKIQEAYVKYASMNLSLQKSLSVPDVALGYIYDRGNSYTYNYSAVTLQTSLPVFNRNQGNIKMAGYQVKSNEKALEFAHLGLNNDVIIAFTQASKTEYLYQNVDKQFVHNFNTLIQGVIEGYEKKTISLVEFMDFFDSYKQNVVQFNTLRNNRIQSYLKLNYSVAKSVFTF